MKQGNHTVQYCTAVSHRLREPGRPPLTPSLYALARVLVPLPVPSSFVYTRSAALPLLLSLSLIYSLSLSVPHPHPPIFSPCSPRVL